MVTIAPRRLTTLRNSVTPIRRDLSGLTVHLDPTVVSDAQAPAPDGDVVGETGRDPGGSGSVLVGCPRLPLRTNLALVEPARVRKLLLD